MEYFTWEITYQTTLIDWFKNMHLSKNKINFLIDNNCCFVCSMALKRDSILNVGDFLMIDLSKFESPISSHDKFDLEILYEDDYLIIVNKKPGFIVHSDGVTLQPTIQDMVISYLRAKNDNHNAYPAHRLDTDTSGCLMFCKDIITLGYYSYMFSISCINKVYLALIEGHIKDKIVVNMGIGKDRHVNGKMVASPNGLSAISIFEMIEKYKNCSLVRVKIKTGRTHQIRVHASFIKHPLVGDVLYGSKVKASRVMLHSFSLAFYNLSKEEDILITCDVPKCFNEFMK